MSKTTFNEELKKTLYTKLHCLRLEVHASIVDDIKKTVDELFNTPTSPKEVKSAEAIVVDLRNESALYAKRQGSHDNPDTTAHDFFEGAQFGVTYASQLHPVSKSEGELPEFSQYLINEINGYQHSRDGWKEKTTNYEAYDLVVRVLRQVADKYLVMHFAPVSKDALTQAVEPTASDITSLFKNQKQ